jgi:hypothetical protein
MLCLRFKLTYQGHCQNVQSIVDVAFTELDAHSSPSEIEAYRGYIVREAELLECKCRPIGPPIAKTTARNSDVEGPLTEHEFFWHVFSLYVEGSGGLLIP